MPIAVSAGPKKARAKKATTKEPIDYMLFIRVTCGDKKIVEESSMRGLQELSSLGRLRHRGQPYAWKVDLKQWVRAILVFLSRLWGCRVADRGTDKGADF